MANQLPDDRRHQNEPVEVVVTDIRMPFVSMVIFMVKWAIASIPAMLIIAGIILLVGLLFSSCIIGGVGAIFQARSAGSAPPAATSAPVAAQSSLVFPTPTPQAPDDFTIILAKAPTPTPIPTPIPSPTGVPQLPDPGDADDPAHLIYTPILVWDHPPGPDNRRSVEIQPLVALHILSERTIEGVIWNEIEIAKGSPQTFRAWITKGALDLEKKDDLPWKIAFNRVQ